MEVVEAEIGKDRGLVVVVVAAAAVVVVIEAACVLPLLY